MTGESVSGRGVGLGVGLGRYRGYGGITKEMNHSVSQGCTTVMIQIVDGVSPGVPQVYNFGVPVDQTTSPES